MRRLRDESDISDPAMARLAEAVKTVDPLDRSPARQARVLAALDRTANASRRPWVLRPALVTVLVLGLAAAASAMFGRSSVEPKPPVAAPPPPAAAPRVVPAPPSPPPIVLPPAPLAPAPSPRKPPAAKRPDPPKAAPAAAPEVSSPNHEAAIVAAAVRVLRSEHDAKRARGLLEDYRRDYPNGLLVEEALAFEIEAATTYDGDLAAQLGTEYMGKYPHGRFTAAAERARKR